MLAYLGLFGLAVTLYAIDVERKAIQGKKALCDVSGMSCSRVLVSPYAKIVGKLFGLNPDHPLNLPNTYYGALYYVAVVLYGFYPFTLIPGREVMLVTVSGLSLGACLGFAYILYFKLKDICIVCMVTYAVNACIFYYSLKECS